MTKFSTTINGEKYNLTDNPKHGVIKRIKSRQNQLIVVFFEKHKDEVDEIMKNDMDASVDSIMQSILLTNPSEMTRYAETCEELNIIATISLATNRIWTDDELDELGEKDLKNIYDKCSKAIGGGYSDFLEGCQIISIPESLKNK